MKVNGQKGFSLIELLLVVVIVGIIAALAVPALRRAARAAENGTTFAALRTINSTQVGFYSQNSRFGRLPELNQILGTSLGTTVGDRIVRGQYVFEMTPVTPTDEELRTEYTITATRTATDDIVYSYEVTQSGRIRQILPFAD
jgi:prepilin-type N-terminal cleavage/methylation domain-containing protein